MKKSILIFSIAIAACSLTALGYSKWNKKQECAPKPSHCSSKTFYNHFAQLNMQQANVEIFYKIGNRWGTMTKDQLSRVKLITDITKEPCGGKIRDNYSNVTVSVLHNDKDVRDIKITAQEQSPILSEAQLDLLQNSDYSTNLRITALSRIMDPNTGIYSQDSLIRYMTIAPEKEASYAGGYDALIEYIKTNIQHKLSMIQDSQLKPAKFFFTVTENGQIKNVKLVDESGYTTIDNELVEIIKNMPLKWNPAENMKGEKVHQELVFYFGKMGC